MSIIFRQDADIPEYHFMAFSESLEELILTGISNDDLVEVKKTDLQVGIKYREPGKYYFRKFYLYFRHFSGFKNFEDSVYIIWSMIFKIYEWCRVARSILSKVSKKLTYMMW